MAKGRTETRIASGFRNPESLMAPRDLVFGGREEEERRTGVETD